jgi:EAL domain-containing protein (putative c-di-GMP-specific phosphodiesterase class I)
MAPNSRRGSQIVAIDSRRPNPDDATLASVLRRAIEGLYMAFQPIVSWSAGEATAYEALVRTREPALARPDLLFSAAERLDMIVPLGRAIRSAVARSIDDAPVSAMVFVNIHGGELADDELYDPMSWTTSAPDTPASRALPASGPRSSSSTCRSCAASTRTPRAST